MNQDLYRKNAEEARLRANLAPREVDKMAWLDLAASWTRLAGRTHETGEDNPFAGKNPHGNKDV